MKTGNGFTKRKGFLLKGIHATIKEVQTDGNRGSKDMKLANIFQSGMVLQRDLPIKLWGTAKPQTEVAVNGQKTISQEIGTWEIELPALPAGGPHEFKIQSEGETILLQNVLMGDVWLCSGQSNMELPMSRVKRAFPGEVETAVNDEIRQFHVPVTYKFDGPATDAPGNGWISVAPETTDAFSATGYFFAKKIQQETGAPIGLILSAAGGTPIETWLSSDSLQKFPEHLPALEQVQAKGYIESIQQEEAAQNGKWHADLDAFDLGLHDQWMAADFNDSKWPSIALEENFADYSELQEPGAIWLRKVVELPAGSGQIDLGTIIDADFVYFNGELVGSTGYQYPPRIYSLSNVKEGKNTIAIRLIANNGTGGFTFGKDRHLLINGEKISLDGTWKFKRGVTLPKIGPTTFFQNKPTGCYNAMIAPLSRFAIKGVLWYQGESNAGNPEGYGERLQELASSWRQQFGLGDFPFIGVQLANWVHTGLNWSWLRQEQSQLLKLSNTGLAIAIDAGEANDLHPLDKKTIGERLALQALKIAYGQEIIFQGPTPVEINQTEEAIFIEFDAPVTGMGSFEIEGDQVAIPVKAEINERIVKLTGIALEKAEYVRYAWANNPTGILYNEEGLPAAPFRIAL